MLEHIVKNNQSISDILKMYNLTLEEIKECNFHITNFERLIPGTKIKIPILSEEVEQILSSTESFVMDYYPKIEVEFEEVKTETNKVDLRKDNPRGKPYPGIIPPKCKYPANE